MMYNNGIVGGYHRGNERGGVDIRRERDESETPSTYRECGHGDDAGRCELCAAERGK